MMRGRQTRKRSPTRMRRLVERKECRRYRWWETWGGSSTNGAHIPAATVPNRESFPSSVLFFLATASAMTVLVMRRMAAGMAEKYFRKAAISENVNTLTRVCGKMKSILLSVWTIVLFLVNRFVSWNSATPLVRDNMEMSMPPSCKVIAFGSVLMPSTKTM